MNEYKFWPNSLEAIELDKKEREHKAKRKLRKENRELRILKKRKRKYNKERRQLRIKMRLDQANMCMICSEFFNKTNKKACLDHCHTTGKLRDMLCSSCNVGLGMFYDRVVLLESAIDYLKRHHPIEYDNDTNDTI